MTESFISIPLSCTKEALDSILNKENYSPEKLVSFFEKDFAEEYSSDVGVWEGYSLKEHTLMVLNQFEKYFADKPLPGGVDHNFFRVILTLHDIRKLRAIEEGERSKEHEYTFEIVEKVLTQLEYKNSDVLLAKSLMTGYPLGKFVLTGDLEKAVVNIKQAAEKANMDLADFFDLQIIYYQVDASSYTEDAGGIRSLDYLFRFEPENRKISFVPELEQAMAILKKNLLS